MIKLNARCQHNGTCVLSRASVGQLQPECKCPDTNYEGRLCELDKCGLRGDSAPSMIINTYYFRCEATYCKNGGQGFRQEAGACVCRCLQVEGNTR